MNHHKARRQAVVVEANAIGTAYLRAGLVPDPGRTELRCALLDYARTRTAGGEVITTRQQLERKIKESWEARSRIWPAIEEIERASPPGKIEALLVAAVGEVIDTDAVRLAAIKDTLPPVVVVMLLLIAAATMAVAGYNAGMAGRISRWRAATLASVLAAIILTIVDFDRSDVGFIRVPVGSIESLIAEMEAELER